MLVPHQLLPVVDPELVLEELEDELPLVTEASPAGAATADPLVACPAANPAAAPAAPAAPGLTPSPCGWEGDPFPWDGDEGLLPNHDLDGAAGAGAGGGADGAEGFDGLENQDRPELELLEDPLDFDPPENHPRELEDPDPLLLENPRLPEKPPRRAEPTSVTLTKKNARHSQTRKR